MPRPVNHDDVIRRFFATLIGVPLAKDGQVPGLTHWLRNATDFAADQAWKIADWCWIKIERDRREPDECISAGIAYFHEQCRLHQPPPFVPLPTAEEVRALVSTLCSAFDGPAPLRLTEAQVADACAQAEKLRSLGLAPGLASDDAIANP